MTDNKIEPIKSQIWNQPTFCSKHGRDFLLTANQRFDCKGETGLDDARNTRDLDSYWEEVDSCDGCARAKEAASFWQKIEDECGIQVGCKSLREKVPDLNRRAFRCIALQELLLRFHGHGINPWIGHEYDENTPPRRGAPVRPKADVVAEALAGFFRSAGGEVEARIRNDPHAQPKTPFGRFVYLIWEHLPSDPAIRLQSPFELLRRARDAERGLRQPKHGRLKNNQIENIELQVLAPVEIGGRQPGEIFTVPGKNGKPWQLYWLKRLADGSVANVAYDSTKCIR